MWRPIPELRLKREQLAWSTHHPSISRDLYHYFNPLNSNLMFRVSFVYFPIVTHIYDMKMVFSFLLFIFWFLPPAPDGRAPFSVPLISLWGLPSRLYLHCDDFILFLFYFRSVFRCPFNSCSASIMWDVCNKLLLLLFLFFRIKRYFSSLIKKEKKIRSKADEECCLYIILFHTVEISHHLVLYIIRFFSILKPHLIQ